MPENNLLARIKAPSASVATTAEGISGPDADGMGDMVTDGEEAATTLSTHHACTLDEYREPGPTITLHILPGTVTDQLHRNTEGRALQSSAPSPSTTADA